MIFQFFKSRRNEIIPTPIPAPKPVVPTLINKIVETPAYIPMPAKIYETPVSNIPKIEFNESMVEHPNRIDSPSREVKLRVFLPSTNKMFYPSANNMIIIDKPDWDKEKGGILMVSIGVKDKNGNDIYDSDILRVDSDFFKAEERIEVSFWKGGYWLGDIGIYDFKESELEIIGNIHQHRYMLS